MDAYPVLAGVVAFLTTSESARLFSCSRALRAARSEPSVEAAYLSRVSSGLSSAASVWKLATHVDSWEALTLASRHGLLGRLGWARLLSPDAPVAAGRGVMQMILGSGSGCHLRLCLWLRSDDEPMRLDCVLRADWAPPVFESLSGPPHRLFWDNAAKRMCLQRLAVEGHPANEAYVEFLDGQPRTPLRLAATGELQAAARLHDRMWRGVYGSHGPELVHTAVVEARSRDASAAAARGTSEDTSSASFAIFGLLGGRNGADVDFDDVFDEDVEDHDFAGLGADDHDHQGAAASIDDDSTDSGAELGSDSKSESDREEAATPAFPALHATAPAAPVNSTGIAAAAESRSPSAAAHSSQPTGAQAVAPSIAASEAPTEPENTAAPAAVTAAAAERFEPLVTPVDMLQRIMRLFGLRGTSTVANSAEDSTFREPVLQRCIQELGVLIDDSHRRRSPDADSAAGRETGRRAADPSRGASMPQPVGAGDHDDDDSEGGSSEESTSGALDDASRSTDWSRAPGTSLPSTDPSISRDPSGDPSRDPSRSSESTMAVDGGLPPRHTPSHDDEYAAADTEAGRADGPDSSSAVAVGGAGAPAPGLVRLGRSVSTGVESGGSGAGNISRAGGERNTIGVDGTRASTIGCSLSTSSAMLYDSESGTSRSPRDSTRTRRRMVLVGRKLIGDPNVPSGQISFACELHPRNIVPPEVPATWRPLQEMTAPGAPRSPPWRPSAADVRLCLRVVGQINMSPIAWRLLPEDAFLILWNRLDGDTQLGDVAVADAAAGSAARRRARSTAESSSEAGTATGASVEPAAAGGGPRAHGTLTGRRSSLPNAAFTLVWRPDAADMSSHCIHFNAWPPA